MRVIKPNFLSMSTFTKEISFINPAFFDKDIKPAGQHVEKEETKTATFKELSRTDKDQRKFQFMLMSVFKADGNDSIRVDHDVLCDIAEKAIDVLLVIDAKFTEIDKVNFLNDNGAVINFGTWFLWNKISPFFSLLIKK